VACERHLARPIKVQAIRIGISAGLASRPPVAPRSHLATCPLFAHRQQSAVLRKLRLSAFRAAVTMRRERDPASSQGDDLDEIINNLDRDIDHALNSMDMDNEPTPPRADRPRGATSGRGGRDLGIDDEVQVKVRKRVPKLDAKM
jgi:hypothetical protein